MNFSISFDPGSLKEIAAFAGMPVLLSTQVQVAMQEAAQLLAEAAQANMHWQNPTGALSDSIVPITDSPYEIQIGSDLPYARRREYGFSGMTDSLGRYYANDPGAFYMTNALKENAQAVLQLIDNAVSQALGGSL